MREDLPTMSHSQILTSMYPDMTYIFLKKILGHVTMYSHCVGGVMTGVTRSEKKHEKVSSIGFKLVITFRNLFQAGTPLKTNMTLGNSQFQ